jgi:hypothetical protein
LARHEGTLPDTYKQQLEGMTIEEIAIEAARMRSDGRICGTATARMLKWTKHHKTGLEGEKAFMELYRQAWNAEKEARAEGRSARPENRPVKGGRFRPHRNSRDRHDFAYSY